LGHHGHTVVVTELNADTPVPDENSNAKEQS
jgi:hypothetical protein